MEHKHLDAALKEILDKLYSLSHLYDMEIKCTAHNQLTYTKATYRGSGEEEKTVFYERE